MWKTKELEGQARLVFKCVLFSIEKLKNKLDMQLGACESQEGLESLWNNEGKD